MNTNRIEGIAVLVFLIVSWLAATYFVAKKAKGRRERHFVIRAGIATLLGILVFSALDFFILKGFTLGIGAILSVSFVILRRRQLEIRREEAANA